MTEPSAGFSISYFTPTKLVSRSYREVLRLAETDIDEAEFVRDYLNQNLLKFSTPLLRFEGEKINLLCFTIAQAGQMQDTADPNSVAPKCWLCLPAMKPNSTR